MRRGRPGRVSRLRGGAGRRPGGTLAGAVLLLSVASASAGASAGAAPGPDVEVTLADPDITESSGLVAREGLLVTVNDSGDTGRVFAVDRDSGETVGVTTWSDDPTDVEALAPAGDDRPGQVWVADIGDNAGERGSVQVTRVPVGRGDRDVRGEVTTYDLTYPDGPADAETLLVDPATGRLVVVTKGVFGGDVLLAPARLDPDRPNRLRLVGRARSVATDGSFWPDGRHLVVRAYTSATVYTWPGLEQVTRFSLPVQEQGEGIAVDEDGVVLVSSEGVGSPVLRLRLPRVVERAVAPRPDPPAPRPSGPTEPTGPVGATEATGATEPTGRPAWPWVAGGLAGLVLVLAGLGVRAGRVRPPRPRG